ncbi:caspase domain-containing protein [Mycena epipterygia]|nr:caspase domain-containing protein [Mycena epipterygia]
MDPRTTSVVHWSSPSSPRALPLRRPISDQDQCVPFSPSRGTGSTLYQAYSSMGLFAQRHANKAAHAVGLGPQAMVDRIQAFFGDGLDREARLNELQSFRSQALEKKCLRLMKYALPSESFSTQLQAWKGIVMLTTRYPGLRRIFLNCKHIRRVGPLRDSIIALWNRSGDRPDRNPHDLDFQSFAAACIADEDIARILEQSSCPLWCLDETNDQTISVIERLLVASDSEDLGVDIVQDACVPPTNSADVLADTEGVDSFCEVLLIGIQNWMAPRLPSEHRSQCWYRDLLMVICLLRKPRTEDLLPKSWAEAKSDYLEIMVPTPYNLQAVDVFVAQGGEPLVATHETTFAAPPPFQAVSFASCNAGSSMTSGQRKALLIGIRTYNTVGYPELTAAHGDVRKMRDLLISTYNYAPSDISILIDDGIEDHPQPTRDNIFLAITKLVKDAEEGDRFCFHYSGHSTQVDNPYSNSEEDRKDQCLVPMDGEEKMIMDNELRARLIKPLPSGAHLVAILDTCHSGTLLDLPHYRCNRVHVPWTERGKRNREGPPNMVARHGPQPLNKRPPHQGREAPTSSSRGPTGTGAGGLLTRLRTAISRNRAMSLSPAENEKFFCSGFCPRPDLRDHLKEKDDEDAVKADVISLSSCKDSQMAWDHDGQSMTSSLVEILKDNPNQSLKDLLTHLSHATYSIALRRHSIVKMYEQKRKVYAERLGRHVAALKRGNQSTRTLIPPEAPDPLARSSTFPHTTSFVQKLSDELAFLRMRLNEVQARGEYTLDDMDAFQNPELASPHTLDMSRPWRM